MTPIIVTYPRTGSKIITDIIYNYSKQYFNSEGCLQEFLLPAVYRKDNFSFKNNKIEGNYENLPKELWSNNYLDRGIHEILDERISWLEKNPNYVFKLMIHHKFPESVYDYCFGKFDCIFLQRNNTLRSFLSLLFLSEIKHHHEIGTKPISKLEIKIPFHERIAVTWVYDYYKFNMLRARHPNLPCLTYEEVLTANEVDEQKILNFLSWPKKESYNKLKFTTIPTPYEDEDLLSYFQNKNEVIDFIKKFPDIFKQINF